MCDYTEEEIERYLEILHKYTKPKEVKQSEARIKNKCSYCQKNEGYTIYSGYKLCDNCGCQNGHVLGYFDYKDKDKDRLHFRKKSIYQRKYH